jgi:hypothetical protein
MKAKQTFFCQNEIIKINYSKLTIKNYCHRKKIIFKAIFLVVCLLLLRINLKVLSSEMDPVEIRLIR